MKQCRNCKRVWTGPDQARPVQDCQSAVQSSPTFRLDWTGLSPTPDWVRPDWWNHCADVLGPLEGKPHQCKYAFSTTL